MERKPLQIPTDLHKEFKIIATIKGLKLTEAIQEAVSEWNAKNRVNIETTVN